MSLHFLVFLFHTPFTILYHILKIFLEYAPEIVIQTRRGLVGKWLTSPISWHSEQNSFF